MGFGPTRPDCGPGAAQQVRTQHLSSQHVLWCPPTWASSRPIPPRFPSRGPYPSRAPALGRLTSPRLPSAYPQSPLLGCGLASGLAAWLHRVCWLSLLGLAHRVSAASLSRLSRRVHRVSSPPRPSIASRRLPSHLSLRCWVGSWDRVEGQWHRAVDCRPLSSLRRRDLSPLPWTPLTPLALAQHGDF